jgi:hypothetical protein
MQLCQQKPFRVMMGLIYFAGSNTVAKTCIASQQGVAEWLMRWPRDPRSMEVGKLASGLRARRGSNPFPGAILISGVHQACNSEACKCRFKETRPR